MEQINIDPITGEVQIVNFLGVGDYDDPNHTGPARTWPGCTTPDYDKMIECLARLCEVITEEDEPHGMV